MKNLLLALLITGLAGCAHSPESRTVASDEENPSLEAPQPDEAAEVTKIQGFYINGGEPTFAADKTKIRTPIYDLISSAARTLDIEIYEIGDYDVRAAVRSALQRGVKVRIVKDPSTIGEKCPLFKKKVDGKKTIGYEMVTVEELIGTKKNPPDANCKDLRTFSREVAKSPGGKFAPFDKTKLCWPTEGKTGCYEHGKMVIADGARIMLSTGNFNSSNLCNKNKNPLSNKGPEKCNRDYAYVLDAARSAADKAAVTTLKAIFEKDLLGKRHDVEDTLHSTRTPISAASKRITASPYSLQPIIKLIDSAKKTLIVQNQYLKQKDWNDAILRAAQRGVAVSVSLASICAFGPADEKESLKWHDNYDDMIRASKQVKFFTKNVEVSGKPGYMHAKAILVDFGTNQQKAWVGSVNGSDNSVSMNREYGVFFTDSSELALLNKVLEHDLGHSQNETLEETLKCVKDRGGSGDETENEHQGFNF